MITALCIIGYIILMVVTALLLNKYSSEMEKVDCVMGGIFWPFVMCYFIIAIPVVSIMWIIESIADKWDDWEQKHKK